MTWVLWDILFPLLVSFGLGLLLGFMLWRWRRESMAAGEIAMTDKVPVTGDSIAVTVSELEAANITLIGERDKATKSLEEYRTENELLKSQNADLESQFDKTAAETIDEINTVTAPLNVVTEDSTKAELEQTKKDLEGMKISLDAEKQAKRQLELDLLNSKNNTKKLQAKLASASNSSIADEFDVKNSAVVISGSNTDAAKVRENKQIDMPAQAATAVSVVAEKPVVEKVDVPEPVNQAANHAIDKTVNREVESNNATAAGYVPVAWNIPIDKPARSERDKLTDIKGIGSVLEKTLHEVGIYYFKQVASLDEKGIDELQQQIPEFPGRIQRDQWVQQAQQMQREKYGA